MKSARMPSTAVLPAERQCPRCGAPLGGFGPEGLCGGCLLDTGMAADEPVAELDLLLAGARRFGDYELLEEIARGGMGVVFKARQISLNRIVAVKMVLRGEFASVAELARFRAEAETAARLQHPNIVAIHEVGEHEGQPFFSMDYVEGQNLAQLVGNTPLQAQRAAKHLRVIAEAVQYAHERGVLHRDLKPSNVLIDSASDQPRVTDFGLAKRLEGDASLTVTGQVLGSPSFMPPEQVAGKGSDMGPASDLYSLGALLYHLLTGRPPFVAENITATLRLVAESEAVSPRLLNATVPRDLETICLKCLQKEPQRRYGSAKAFAEELNRFLRDEPIRARPAAPAEKFVRWCRRHPAIAGLTGLVALLLVTVAVVSTVLAARLHRANREGQEKLRESLLAQARANRWSGRPGRRFDSLDAIRKAAEIRPGLDLRNEAIAALALVDLRPFKTIHQASVAFSPDYEQYARLDGLGHILVLTTAGDREILRLPPPGFTPGHFLFSRDRRFLTVFGHTNENGAIQVHDLARRRLALALSGQVRNFDIASDSRGFVVSYFGAGEAHPIIVYDLESGTETVSFNSGAMPDQVRFSPSGLQLALSSQSAAEVEIRDAFTGVVTQKLPHPTLVRGLDWQPSGERLACGCDDGNVYVWNLSQSPPKAILLSQGSRAVLPKFSPDGELLASVSWNNVLKLWDVSEGKELLSLSAVGTILHPFSTGGAQLALAFQPDQTDLCEVSSHREYRCLRTTQTTGSAPFGCSFSPDGRLMASGHEDGLRIWDLAAARELAFLPEGYTGSALFSPSSQFLITCGTGGLKLRNIYIETAGDASNIKIVGNRLLLEGSQPSTVSLDAGAERLAVNTGDGWLYVFDLATGRRLLDSAREKGVPDSYRGPSLNPKGDQVAVWDWFGRGAHIWNVEGTAPPRRVGANIFCAQFSPNGRWFVAGSSDSYVFYDAKSWTAHHAIRRPSNGGAHGAIAFSPDRATVALCLAQSTVGLFEADDGRPFAVLEAPGSPALHDLVFSRDGSTLAASGQDGGIHLWDLRLIRQELASMKLDWEAPPLSPRSNMALWGPVRITFLQVPVPARDSHCTARQLDLTAFYNATLTNFSVLTSLAGDDFTGLPTGFQKFAGVEFDVRGVVCLANREPRRDRPAAVTGITVTQRCRSLDFLHASLWAVPAHLPHGHTIAHYVVHYVDGQTQTVPICNTSNIGDFWISPAAPPALETNSTVVAWEGTNAAASRHGHRIELFKFRWENPRPDSEIASLELRSTLSGAAPFIVAITAE